MENMVRVGGNVQRTPEWPLKRPSTSPKELTEIHGRSIAQRCREVYPLGEVGASLSRSDSQTRLRKSRGSVCRLVRCIIPTQQQSKRLGKTLDSFETLPIQTPNGRLGHVIGQ